MSIKLLGRIAKDKITSRFRKKTINEAETFKPLGFRIGAAVELDSLDWRLLESVSKFKFPGGTHIITAHGTMPLHGECFLPDCREQR